MAAIWIALAVLVVGVAGGIAFVVVRGLALWRRMKAMGGAVTAEVDRISSVATEIQAQLDRASASSARLGEAGERLARSRARLDVQLAAVREARRAAGRLLWWLPGV
jgi:hypothetical protein